MSLCGRAALRSVPNYPSGDRMTDIRTPVQHTIEVIPSRSPSAPRRRTRRTLTAVDVVAVGVVTYLVAAVLNASDLQRIALRQPIGVPRQTAISLTNKLRVASHSVGLDQVGRAIENFRGIPDVSAAKPVTKIIPAVSTVIPVTSPAPTTTIKIPTTTTVANASPAVTWLATPATTVPVTTTVSVPKQLFAPGDPIAYWYGGDSLSQGLGRSLERLAGDDHGSTVNGKGVISTGLARPDVFDWTSTITAAIARGGIDVALILLGANDDQTMQNTDAIFDFGTPEWTEEYRQRVAALMAAADQTKVRLVWVGLPPVRQASLEVKLKAIDAIFRQEAGHHQHVEYLDVRSVVGTPDGAYDPYCHDDGSSQVLCRSNDGVHFTDTGYDRLAAMVMTKARSLTT